MQRRLAKKKATKPSLANVPGIDALVALGRRHPGVPGICKSLQPLAPPAMRTILRYSQRTTINNNLGLPNSQVFAGNSCFDPDVTGTGQQPVGYDQWSTIYSRYRVLGSQIRVTAATPSASTNAAGLINIVLTPYNGVGPFSNADAAAAQPLAKRSLFNGFYPQGLGQSDAQLRHSVSTAQMHGLNMEGVLVDDELSATVAANPAQMWYWHILTEAADRATTTNVTLEVTIDYLVDFYELTVLNISADMSVDYMRRVLEIRSQQPVGKKSPVATSADREMLRSMVNAADKGS